MNTHLARGGVAFELDEQLRIVRIGPEEARASISELRPDTGDARLDDLIETGRARYASRHAGERRGALDALWDAFERLKTIDVPGRNNNRLSSEALLAYIADDEYRRVLEADMMALRDIGNGQPFDIRYRESGTHEVPDEAIDYLTLRMVNVLLALLRHSGRLAS